jgi:diadenosine tetraphosphate (Ap4A) HIT family hydrolase
LRSAVAQHPPVGTVLESEPSIMSGPPSAMDSRPISCPLCTPDSVATLWSDDHFRLVKVVDPHLPGFVRLISQQHVAEMSDLSATAQRQMFRLLVAIESAMRVNLSPDKVNVASLGNQVPHLHWHIIPRWKDDLYFPDSIWSAPKRSPAASSAVTVVEVERLARAETFWKSVPEICAAIR